MRIEHIVLGFKSETLDTDGVEYGQFIEFKSFNNASMHFGKHVLSVPGTVFLANVICFDGGAMVTLMKNEVLKSIHLMYFETDYSVKGFSHLISKLSDAGLTNYIYTFPAPYSELVESEMQKLRPVLLCIYCSLLIGRDHRLITKSIELN